MVFKYNKSIIKYSACLINKYLHCFRVIHNCAFIIYWKLLENEFVTYCLFQSTPSTKLFTSLSAFSCIKCNEEYFGNTDHFFACLTSTTFHITILWPYQRTCHPSRMHLFISKLLDFFISSPNQITVSFAIVIPVFSNFYPIQLYGQILL